jgi:transposase
VVSSKYADHLPLYRLERIFGRHGVRVTRRTLSEWNGAVADLLEPIVRTMHREQVCQSPWIQCDDTTLDVQDPSRAPEIRTLHLWVYRGELGEVVYDFTWSRNRDGPLKMLANYRGCLQVDAAPAYDEVFAQHPEIIEVVCMAHARRYFKEAMPTAAVPCAHVLAIIGQFYGIERTASDKHLDAPARQRLRQSQARPFLEKLRSYLQEQQATALPKSPLGTAIGYALRNWAALTPRTDGSRSTTTAQSRRYDRSCWGAGTGSLPAAKRRRTGPRSCVRWCRRASICRSIRSCICATSSSASRHIPHGSCWS